MKTKMKWKRGREERGKGNPFVMRYLRYARRVNWLVNILNTKTLNKHTRTHAQTPRHTHMRVCVFIV